MGMYTKLDISLPIRVERLEELKTFLPFLLDSRESCPQTNHEFFSCPRAPGFLSNSNGITESGSKLRMIGDMPYLDVDTCLKNYDCEIRLFLDWIHPFTYFDGETDVGTYKYEEDYEYSTVFLTSSNFKISLPS